MLVDRDDEMDRDVSLSDSIDCMSPYPIISITGLAGTDSIIYRPLSCTCNTECGVKQQKNKRTGLIYDIEMSYKEIKTKWFKPVCQLLLVKEISTLSL